MFYYIVDSKILKVAYAVRMGTEVINVQNGCGCCRPQDCMGTEVISMQSADVSRLTFVYFMQNSQK